MMPFRPRAYGNVNTTPGGEPKGGWLETEEEYQTAKNEALGENGYGAMVQMQTSAGQEAYAASLINKRRGAGGMAASKPASKSGALRRVVRPVKKF